MKILGIMGSPRKRGNTDLLLDEALRGAKSQGAEVEKLVVSELDISPCREIYGCLRDGNCVIDDDMQQVYVKLMEADHIILASPMFFYGLTSQVKSLIDRCQALWVRKYVLKQIQPLTTERKGVFISVGATKGKRLFDGAILTLKYFFDAIDAKYSAELLVRGVEKKGEIKKHPTALSEAFQIGKGLAQG
jgi:multimeric flavodoxin WrbA